MGAPWSSGPNGPVVGPPLTTANAHNVIQQCRIQQTWSSRLCCSQWILRIVSSEAHEREVFDFICNWPRCFGSFGWHIISILLAFVFLTLIGHCFFLISNHHVRLWDIDYDRFTLVQTSGSRQNKVRGLTLQIRQLGRFDRRWAPPSNLPVHLHIIMEIQLHIDESEIGRWNE